MDEKKSKSNNANHDDEMHSIDIIPIPDVPNRKGCCWFLLCLLCAGGTGGMLYGGIKEHKQPDTELDQEMLFFAGSFLFLIGFLGSSYKLYKSTNCCSFFKKTRLAEEVREVLLADGIQSDASEDRVSLPQ